MNFSNRLKEKKLDLLKKENFIFFLFIIIIFFVDRISKLKILSNFNESVFYVNDFVNFDLIWNIGIGFGLLSTDSTLLYNIVSILIGLVIITLFYIFISSNVFEKFIYSMIIGGALGNFYDRLVFKAVPDFIDLHYNNFHWFVFNVADIFISIGIIALLINGTFKN